MSAFFSEGARGMILILVVFSFAYVVVGFIVAWHVASWCRKDNAWNGGKLDAGDHFMIGLSVLLWPYAAIAFIGFQLFKGLGKLVTR
jgi:hypothetical protein